MHRILGLGLMSDWKKGGLSQFYSFFDYLWTCCRKVSGAVKRKKKVLVKLDHVRKKICFRCMDPILLDPCT